MYKFHKKGLFFYINIFFVLSIWFCIDTNFENIFEILNNYSSWKDENAYKKLFLFFRSSSPFIGFLIFFLTFIYFKKKLHFLTKNKALNYILIILYIYFLFKFIGLLISNNDTYNSYYIFVALFSIFAIANIYNEGLYKISYLISLIILSAIVLIYGFLNYKFVLTTPNLNMYGTFPQIYSSLGDFSSNVIRSSGTSRSTMIILIPLFYLILNDKTKFFFLIPYSKLVYLIPYIILVTMIYLSQSRIVITFLILFSFFSVFYFLWDKTKKYKIQKFFILILLPIIFYNSLIIIKKEINTRLYEREALIEKDGVYTGQVYSAIREIDKKSITTYRYTNWKKVALKSKKPIIGYGPLGDRYLIEENSHNTLVYSYVSGGIVSTILMLIIIIRYTYLCLFLIFIKKIPLQKKNIFIFSSIFTISFLFFRGIGEIGIAIFSIDFLVFLSCIEICEKFKSQK